MVGVTLADGWGNVGGWLGQRWLMVGVRWRMVGATLAGGWQLWLMVWATLADGWQLWLMVGATLADGWGNVG